MKSKIAVQETAVQETAVQETANAVIAFVLSILSCDSIVKLNKVIESLTFKYGNVESRLSRFFPVWGDAKKWSDTYTIGMVFNSSKVEYPYLTTEWASRFSVILNGTELVYADKDSIAKAIQKKLTDIMPRSSECLHPYHNKKVAYAQYAEVLLKGSTVLDYVKA